MNELLTASVKWFSTEKGYGFLTPDNGGDDVFLHHSDLGIDKHSIQPGDRVTFEIETTDRGTKAVNVQLEP